MRNRVAGERQCLGGGEDFRLFFLNSSTAGSATITTTAGAAINNTGTRFFHNATGGTSRHILTASGLLDITQSANAGITVGSVEGSGVVAIGGKTLTTRGPEIE